MKNIRSILVRTLVMIIIISQVFVYMIIPRSENSFYRAGVVNALNSYDEYLMEHLLNIPDKTPGNESDDTERTIQIVQVEDFAFNKQQSDVVFASCLDNQYPFVNEFPGTSVYTDIIVPPPQG